MIRADRGKLEMTIAIFEKASEQIEAVLAMPNASTRPPMLAELYDAAIRGMSQPELLSDREIQKICYVFAARCFAADVRLPG